MVSAGTTKVYSKYSQLALAIVIIGLSSQGIKNKSSLNNISSIISDFNVSNKGVALILNDSTSVTAATLTSSLFTLVSGVVTFVYPNFLKKSTNEKKTLKNHTTKETNRTQKYLNIPSETILTKNALTASAPHTSYAVTLVACEFLAFSFWLVMMIVSLSNYASNSCTSIPDLLEQYNVTGTSSTESLLNYFNIFDNSSSTQFDELYGLLDGTNLSSISISDMNSTSARTTLLLSMCSDCEIKKTSMALTFLLWVAHLLSSTLNAKEVQDFFNSFIQLQEKVKRDLPVGSQEDTNQMISDSKDDASAKSKNESEEAKEQTSDTTSPNTNMIIANKETPNVSELQNLPAATISEDDNNSSKKTEFPAVEVTRQKNALPVVQTINEAKIYFFFKHRWALYHISYDGYDPDTIV